MATEISKDLKKFHRFVGEKLNSGGADLSPEEALDEWRVLNPAPEELAESVSAIRRALADMRAGDRGRPADDVLAEIRQRLATHRRDPSTACASQSSITRRFSECSNEVGK